MATEEDFVGGAGWISDESSFLGDEDEKWEIESSLAGADTAAYWVEHARSPAAIAWQATRAIAPLPGAKGKAKLRYPFDGNLCFKQSDETTDAFLRRLPPRTTIKSPNWPNVSGAELESGFWIWVNNPVYHRDQLEETEPTVDEYVKDGKAIIDGFQQARANLEAQNPNAAKATITRKLKPQREQMEKDLYRLMTKHHVKTGKWLLRPYATEVNDTWREVVNAVWEGQLGSAAKVSPAVNEDEFENGVRVICIYTNDFEDVADVRRVLDVLVRLRLVNLDGHGIFYKADGYTHLRIDSGNNLNLKVSLYGSKDMMKNDRR